MALAAQALEAKKARKPLEQGGALEQVGARMERVMGLTNQGKRRLEAVRLSDGLGLAFAGRRSLHVNDLLVSPDK